MPRFSKASNAKLVTCHEDIQLVFNVVVKYFDCKILYGRRTCAAQFNLFKKNRVLRRGKWVKVGPTVTNCDGYKIPSNHNKKPLSDAIDAVAYPIDYSNIKRQILFIGFVLGVARILKRANKIKSYFRSGIDWDSDTFIADTRFFDYPHFERYI